MNVDRKFQYHCVITMLYRIHVGSKIKRNNHLDFVWCRNFKQILNCLFDRIQNSIHNEHEYDICITNIDIVVHIHNKYYGKVVFLMVYIKNEPILKLCAFA